MISRTFRDKARLAPQKKEIRRVHQKRGFKRPVFFSCSQFGDIPEFVASDDLQLAQSSFFDLSRRTVRRKCGSGENLHDNLCVLWQMRDRGPRSPPAARVEERSCDLLGRARLNRVVGESHHLKRPMKREEFHDDREERDRQEAQLSGFRHESNILERSPSFQPFFPARQWGSDSKSRSRRARELETTHLLIRGPERAKRDRPGHRPGSSVPA